MAAPANSTPGRARLAFALALAVLWVAGVGFLLWKSGWRLTVENWPADVRLPLIAVVQTWVWRGVLVALAVVTLLLATVRWWAAPATLPAGGSRAWTRAHVLVFLLLILAAAFIRWPRLDLSVYNDEGQNFSRLICGMMRVNEHGEPQSFRRATWLNTTWLMSGGNNSQPFSLAARYSHETWQSWADMPREALNETAYRLPAFIGGLAGLALLAAGARQMGGGAMMAAVLLAGAWHGWLVRYSTEARGHGLLLLALGLMFWCLHHALRTGRWRWWLGFSGGIFLGVWSFPGAVYLPVALMGCLMIRQGWHWWRGSLSFVGAFRPVPAAAMGIIPAAPLMAPLVPQLAEILATRYAFRGEMGAEWWREVLAFIFFGARWSDTDAGNPILISLERWVSVSPWVGLLAAFTVLLTLLGCWRLWVLSGGTRLWLLGTLAALLLGWALTASKGNYLNFWYVLYATPLVVLAQGAALAWMWDLRGVVGKTLAVLSGAAALAVPASITMAFWERPKQNDRAAIVQARGAIYPHYQGTEGEKTLVAAFWCGVTVYDPAVIIPKNADGLTRLVQQARDEERPLYVVFSHRPLALQHSAELVGAVEDSPDFAKVATYHGQEEPQFDVHLFRLVK